MKKLNHRRRRRRLTQRTKCAITLTVEALEPRLVFSAAGLGFELAGEPLTFQVRDHGNHDAYRSEITEKIHDDRSNLRFELSDRHTDRLNTNSQRLELRSPKPWLDGHTRGGQLHEPFSARPFERGRRNSHVDDHSAEPLGTFSGAEGESTLSTYEVEDHSFNEPVGDIFEPHLFSETTIRSTTVDFVSLAPTTSLLGGDGSRGFGPSTTPLTPPPRAVSIDSVSQQSGSPATLPVAVPASSPASDRTRPTTLTIESPIIRFDSATADGDAMSVQPASPSPKIAEPGVEMFVSLASSDLASWWNVDGESFEAALATSGPLTESVRPSATIEYAVDSLMASADDWSDQYSAEALWAGVSEGGFIEIDTESADNSRERFELLEDSEGISSSRRLPTQTLRDALWFDFGDARLELLIDSTAAKGVADKQALDNVADADTWLLDDGGMIVLTSSQFTHQAVEVGVDDTNESSSTSQSAAVENDIPMDAVIGVFHAIEVAAAPVEQQDPIESPENTPVPLELEAGVDVLPAAEQAAKKSDSGQAEPSRAASMPLLFTISAFLLRGRENRKKVAAQQCKA